MRRAVERPTLKADRENPMPNILASFAIHVDDVAKSREFYETVFGWSFEPWGPPDFYLIHTGDAASPGVQGLMHKRMEPKSAGGPNCFECTISVGDVDAIAKAVEKAGGKIVLPRAPIPTVGVLIKFEDPSGNLVVAMQYETPPHT